MTDQPTTRELADTIADLLVCARELDAAAAACGQPWKAIELRSAARGIRLAAARADRYTPPRAGN